MGERDPYLSDLSDERWELIRPVLTAWKGGHPSVSGHQGKYDLREIVNAILYQARTGCQWRYLPHDLPPYGAVYYYFAGPSAPPSRHLDGGTRTTGSTAPPAPTHYPAPADETDQPP
nr:transposase [Kitasatospora sp. MAP12-44]